jgi:hypothetical protein
MVRGLFRHWTLPLPMLTGIMTYCVAITVFRGAWTNSSTHISLSSYGTSLVLNSLCAHRSCSYFPVGFLTTLALFLGVNGALRMRSRQKRNTGELIW